MKSGVKKFEEQSQTTSLLTQRLDNKWKVSIKTAVSPLALFTGSVWLRGRTLHTNFLVQSVDVRVQPVTLDGLHDVDNVREETHDCALRLFAQTKISSPILFIKTPGKCTHVERNAIFPESPFFQESLLISFQLRQRSQLIGVAGTACTPETYFCSRAKRSSSSRNPG